MLLSRSKVSTIDHFSGLSDAELERLNEESTIREYGAGDTILDLDRSQALYSFLVEGRWWMRRTIIGVTEPREWINDRPGNWHGGVGFIDKVAPPCFTSMRPARCDGGSFR